MAVQIVIDAKNRVFPHNPSTPVGRGENFDRHRVWGTPGADSADKARGSVLDLPASLYPRCRRGPLSLTIGVVPASLTAINRVSAPATHSLLGPTAGLADRAGTSRDLALDLLSAFPAKLHLAMARRWNDSGVITRPQPLLNPPQARTPAISRLIGASIRFSPRNTAGAKTQRHSARTSDRSIFSDLLPPLVGGPRVLAESSARS
jgi:hypothetical protein